MLSFDDLQSLVLRATEPSRENFYRRTYGMQPFEPALRIDSMEMWARIHPITKDDLIREPLHARSYIPLSSLDHLRASSGTSGLPPLFSPRTHVRNMDYRLQYHDFKNAFMAYTIPMMPHWHESFLAEHGQPPRVIAYDPKYPRASAQLARDAGVDAVSVFLYHISALGEAMKEIGIAPRIRFLEVTGEVCSRAQYDYMRATFPNAVIVQSYNSSEVEDAHIGMPCRPMTGEEPLALYHPKSTHYLEILDADTGNVIEPVAGAEGDLLVSAYAGEPAAFPLIRYRIGDTIRIVETMCPHGTWSFTVLGRTEMDFIKLPGGVLRADEVARVLRTMPRRVRDQFELHCYEDSSAHGAIIRPVLHVETDNGEDLDSLAHDISHSLRVAPDTTYADGVSAGAYAPLQCEPLEKTQGAKTRRVVRHAV